MELRDKTIKKVDPITYARFLLFFPTISSGPIDRYRRFKEDYDRASERLIFEIRKGKLGRYTLDKPPVDASPEN